VSGGSSEPGRSVTSKVIAIIEAVSSGGGRLTLSQISRRARLPIATVHRLAGELVGWGGLEKDAGGAYRIGARLWEIGSLTPNRTGLRELAMPFMQDLYEVTHENVQLAVLDGADALVVEKISGRRSVPTITRVGGRLPLHATGVGKVLLAFSPAELAEGLIARGLSSFTPSTITDPDRLRDALAEARRAGFAQTHDEMTWGAVSVGCPIYAPAGQLAAALSLVVRSQGADVHRLAFAVHTASLALSRRLTEAWDGSSPASGAAFPLTGNNG
jgi:DNA-binding IclR family transcriptional regulator